MLRTVSLLTALLLSAASLMAQSAGKPDRPFSASVQGGALFSVNENSFTYVDNDRTGELFTFHGGLNFGYRFTGRYSARLSASFGRNVSACNTDQTHQGGFYPYKFNSINVFADWLINLSNEWAGFSPIFYLGIGGAYTFGFTESGHPWQKLSHKNTVPGARMGLMFEYDFSEKLGMYLDFCGEGYADTYNGLQPHKGDHDQVYGSAGFPYDLRGTAALGVVFHF